MKLLFTGEKPLIPGWYWHRMSRGETEPVVVYVEPQLDRVGTGDKQTAHTLSHTEGGVGRTLGGAGQTRQHTSQKHQREFN